MSEKIDKFCDDLKAHLNGIEAKVLGAKADLDEAIAGVKADAAESRENAKAAVEEKIAAGREAIEAEKQKVQQARDEMHARIEEKKGETEAKIAEWKTQREIHRLQKRADNAEDYAAWAVIYALDALDEASIATLEAVAARMDAEEAEAAAG